MKCVMCNREIEKVEHWVSGNPIGPKCFEKRFGKPLHIANKVIESDQDDLFFEDESMAEPKQVI